MKISMKYIQYLVLISGCILLAGLKSSLADVSFVPVTWTAAGDTLGWTNLTPVAGETITQNGGVLNMNFVGAGPGIESDTMAADNLEGYNGDYSAYANLTVSFDFQGYASSAQSLYFESTAGGGSTWAYDLTIPDSAMHNYTVSLNNATGWNKLTGGAVSFATALTLVDLIGITVQHSNAGTPFDYNLDNWTYDNTDNAVPEPGSLALLFSALGSFGFTYRFRRKKNPQAPNQA